MLELRRLSVSGCKWHCLCLGPLLFLLILKLEVTFFLRRSPDCTNRAVFCRLAPRPAPRPWSWRLHGFFLLCAGVGCLGCQRHTVQSGENNPFPRKPSGSFPEEVQETTGLSHSWEGFLSLPCISCCLFAFLSFVCFSLFLSVRLLSFFFFFFLHLSWLLIS